MAESNTLLRLWPGFRASTEYQQLKDYPEVAAWAMVQLYGEEMAEATPLPPAEWQPAELRKILDAFSTQVEADPAGRGELLPQFQIVRAFQRYLVNHHLVDVTPAELTALHEAFVRQHDLTAADLVPHVATHPVFQGVTPARLCTPLPTLADQPAWDAQTAASLVAETAEWVVSYRLSADWANRPIGVHGQDLAQVVSLVTQFLYLAYRQTPKHWTAPALKVALTQFLAHDVPMPLVQYQLLAPAGHALLTYVEQQGWLSSQQAALYRQTLDSAAPTMLANAKLPANHGDEKMRALDALDARARLALHDPQLMRELQHIYDSDPERLFLQYHQDRVADRQWDENTAMTVHEAGMAAGVRLWAMREEAKLPAYLAVDDVIAFTSQLADTIYAQTLLLPTQWTPELIAEIAQQLEQACCQNGWTTAELRLVLNGAITAMAKAGHFSDQTARRLTATLHAEAAQA